MFVTKIAEVLKAEDMSYGCLGREIGISPNNISNYMTGKTDVNVRLIISFLDKFLIPRYRDPELVDYFYNALMENGSDVKVCFNFLPPWVKDRMVSNLLSNERKGLAKLVKETQVINFSDLESKSDVKMLIDSLRYGLCHHTNEHIRYKENIRALTHEEIYKDYKIESVVYDITRLQDISLRKLTATLNTTERSFRTMKNPDTVTLSLDVLIPLLNYLQKSRLKKELTKRTLEFIKTTDLPYRLTETDLIVNGVKVSAIEYFNEILPRNFKLIVTTNKKGRKVFVHTNTVKHKTITEELFKLYSK